MNRKMLVGSQVDIDASFDGGPVDTSVTYSVPESQQSIITVGPGGDVTALAEGTAVVQIRNAATGGLRQSLKIKVVGNEQALQAGSPEAASRLQVAIKPLGVPDALRDSDYSPPLTAGYHPPLMTDNPSNGYIAWTAVEGAVTSIGAPHHAFDGLSPETSCGGSVAAAGQTPAELQAARCYVGVVLPQPMHVAAVRLSALGQGVADFTVQGVFALRDYADVPSNEGRWTTLGKAQPADFGSGPADTFNRVLITTTGKNGEFPFRGPVRKLRIVISFPGLSAEDVAVAKIFGVELWGQPL